MSSKCVHVSISTRLRFKQASILDFLIKKISLWEYNACPHTCMANPYCTELSPQSQKLHAFTSVNKQLVNMFPRTRVWANYLHRSRPWEINKQTEAKHNNKTHHMLAFSPPSATFLGNEEFLIKKNTLIFVILWPYPLVHKTALFQTLILHIIFLRWKECSRMQIFDCLLLCNFVGKKRKFICRRDCPYSRH